ncbi:hypothetical protein WDA44_01820 [Acinetobacter nosocomialis]|uniref:hypothetical protein n=1 Tax=Acinetobacter nosocomialis TaxID=106654 RepID=UPI00374EE72E
MKPEQFIREFGEKKAREVVEDAPNDSTLFRLGGIEEIPTYLKVKDGKYWRYSWRSGFREACQSTYNKINDAGELVSLTDLKRLVESVDRVNAFGGLKDAKAVVKMGKHYKYLKAHISNYESIYGGGDES